MSIGFLSTFYNKKVIYLFIFFIIIGLVVFSYQSGFNKKAYEGFDDSEKNDASEDRDKWPHYGGGQEHEGGHEDSHDKANLDKKSHEYPSSLIAKEDRIAFDDLKARDTVGLPKINGNPVFFDIKNGNIYIADGDYLKVISRDHVYGSKAKKFKINDKKLIQSNINSNTFSNIYNIWTYNPKNNTEYLLYMANNKKTLIVICNKTNNNLKQLVFNFSENVKPVDLSDRHLIKYLPIKEGATPNNEIEFVGVFQDKYFRRIKEIKTLEPKINRGSVIWPDDTETDPDDIVKRIHALTSTQYNSHYIGERVFVKIGYEYTKDTDDYHYLRGKITKAHDDGTYDVEFYKSILAARSKEKNTNIPNKDIYTEVL